MSAPGAGGGRGRQRPKRTWPLLLLFQAKGGKWGQGPVGKDGGGRPRELHLLDPLSPSVPPKPLLKPGAFPVPPPSASSSSSG